MRVVGDPDSIGNRKSRGQTILLVALGVVVFFAFLAFVIDWGGLFFTRQKLRNHCDGCALAGAQNLPNSTDAKSRATDYYARNVSLTDADILWQSDSGNTSYYKIGIDDVYVTTPYTDAKLSAAGVLPQNAIEVKACRNLVHHIGALLGAPRARVCARAVAVIMAPQSVGPSDNVVPIGYPISKPANEDPSTWIDPSTWTAGNTYTINLPTPNGVNGNNYYVALGGAVWGNTGGAVYRNNWMFGAQQTYSVGQIITTEPGTMNGPTSDGVNYRVNQCPSATWNNIPPNCPRVITTLLVDTSISSYQGRADVKIVGFAKWFILPYPYNSQQFNVSAVFLGMNLGGSGTCASCPVFNIGQVALVE